MKLHFNPNQPYQQDAIRAVTDIFEGQEMSNDDFGFSLQTTGSILNGFGNSLTIDEEQILKNTITIQERNGIENKTSTLHGMNFSVEMETGTGKTYVYLRTIYEFNLRNFAISNAIQMLVLNIDAFAKDENIINKPNDKLSGKSQT
jgi:type III restriction enzyme